MRDLRLTQASNKMEDGWALLRLLEAATDALTFKAVYGALLVCCRSIPDAVDRGLKPLLRQDRGPKRGDGRLTEFSQWRKEKLRERQEPGGLLQFVETARDADVHEGKHQLLFPSLQFSADSLSDSNGPPGTTAIVINPDGPFYLVDTDTPLNRRIPVEAGQGTVRVFLAAPIEHHLGEELTEVNPLAVARIAVQYYALYLWEAKEKFVPTA
jgi:hypothetical protein